MTNLYSAYHDRKSVNFLNIVDNIVIKPKTSNIALILLVTILQVKPQHSRKVSIIM